MELVSNLRKETMQLAPSAVEAKEVPPNAIGVGIDEVRDRDVDCLGRMFSPAGGFGVKHLIDQVRQAEEIRLVAIETGQDQDHGNGWPPYVRRS